MGLIDWAVCRVCGGVVELWPADGGWVHVTRSGGVLVTGHDRAPAA